MRNNATTKTAITKSSSIHDGNANSKKDKVIKKKRKFDTTKGSKDESEELSSKNKKRLLKQQRQSRRKYNDDVVQLKKLWNQLRVKPKKKQQQQGKGAEEGQEELLMRQLMELLHGKMAELSMQHDASRVVQAAVQFGTMSQRQTILLELAPSLPTLSKVQYAHFVVLKLIHYCSHAPPSDQKQQQQALLMSSFQGHIVPLATHSVASQVIEALFTTFSFTQTYNLRMEMYGPHMTFLHTNTSQPQQQGAITTTPSNSSSSSSLLLTLVEQYPEKRNVTLDFVWNKILMKCCEKQLLGLAYVQQLLWEYISCYLSSEEGKKYIRDKVVPSIVDQSLHLVSTRQGARVVSECASYGTAKDRKRILKSFTTTPTSTTSPNHGNYSSIKSILLQHPYAYLPIIRVIDVTDDTVTTHKLLLKDILTPPAGTTTTTQMEDTESTAMNTNPPTTTNPLLDLALHDNASKLLLRLLVPNQTFYLDPVEIQVFHPATLDGIPTSKKDLRHTELLGYIQSTLVDMAVKHTKELMTSIPGSRVLRQVYLHLSTNSDMVGTAILDTITSGGWTEDTRKGSNDTSSSSTSILEDPVGHIFLKNLIHIKDNEEGGTATSSLAHGRELSFATMFYSKFKGKLMEKVAFCNRGAFVLEALTNVPEVKEDVLRELRKHKGNIKKHANQKGFEVLLQKL